MTAVDPRVSAPTGAVPRSARGSVGSRVRSYVALTKPRIIELLLVTTIPAMVLAAGGLPAPWTVVATLVGGTLAAAGANTLNSFYDRDIDQLMVRTGRRPMATGEITPRAALTFGLALSVLSVAFLWATTNAFAAVLTAVAIAFYVLVYTMVLKRRTAQNIVWGGAAGCMPVLIGWTAVTGSLSWAPVVLFLIVFFWTPPHYWPLSLRFRDDYAAAGVPMLPVVEEPRTVARHVVAYSWVMVAVSLALVPVAGMGWIYAVSAVLLGAAFLLEAYRLLGRVRRGERDVQPMRLFHWSISYLALLFLAVAIDPFLHFPLPF